MGFCLLNNVAITAAALREQGRRVLIVDWDAHHGNGTQDMFFADPDVMYVSLHEWPLYPGTGRLDDVGDGRGLGTTVNFPLPAGATGDVYLDALDTVVAPLAERFAPDWVLVSAGFDAHRADPLTGLGLRSGDFADLAARVSEFALAGRTVAFLEGGYDLDALRDSVAATASALVGGVGAPGTGHRRRPRRRGRARGPRSAHFAIALQQTGPSLPIRCMSGRCLARVGPRSVASLRRRTTRVGRAHQGRIATVHPYRRTARADRPRTGLTRRDRAHRVRDHAEAAGRGVHLDERGGLRLLGRRARPLPRQRVAPARLGRPRACGRCRARSPTSKSSDCRRRCAQLTQHPRGLVLVTGPTGSGKTTTLAAMVDYINATSQRHIITIEDPIEVLHADKSSIVNQREVGTDTADFHAAMKRVLRQDPDVILVGEMRDSETVRTALAAAETGHLVFSTLHTISATDSINRVVDFFPPHEQKQTRMSLAASLRGIVSQRLVEKRVGGRAPAVEVLVATGRVFDKIVNAEETHEIETIIAEGEFYGMQTFDQSLLDLYGRGVIELREAMSASTSPHDLRLMIEQWTMVQAAQQQQAAAAGS